VYQASFSCDSGADSGARHRSAHIGATHRSAQILGVLLIANGVAYPIASIAALFFPEHAPLVDRILFPALLGELWIMLWLLIKGAKVPDLAMRAGAAASN
jgi:hypothetical protein